MTWILGESIRNVSSGTTHALRYGLTLAVILCVCAAADVLSVNALILRAKEYQESGASIMTLEAAGLIDGATCDSFAKVPGVRASGAIQQEANSLTPAALPGGSVASFRISEGAAGLFRVDDDSKEAGILLSRDVIDTLGLQVGSLFTSDLAPVRVRGTFAWPQDGRRPGYAYAALSPDSADEAFDECWVDAWPTPPNLARIMRTALNPDPTGDTKVISSQVNVTKGASFDGARSYEDRVTRFAPFVAIMAGLFAGYASTRSRRLELASAQHVGVTRVQQLAQTLFETSLWVLAAGVLTSSTVCALVSAVASSDRFSLVEIALHASVPGLLSTLLGSLIASAFIKEAHLFSYFKAR